jgi:hypothetical protein
MIENVEQQNAKSSARRRLVRGAFSAPAVMTLFSGSAIAASSTKCVANQQTNVISAPISAAGTPDNTWLRVPLFRHINGGDWAGFVRRGDVASLMPGAANYFDAQGASILYQCVIIVGTFSPFVVGAYYTDASVRVPATTGALPSNATNFYAGVRVDGTGKVVGAQAFSTSGSALHTSCWTSFGGAAPF